MKHSTHSDRHFSAGALLTADACRTHHGAFVADRFFASAAGYASDFLFVLEAVVGAVLAIDRNWVGPRNEGLPQEAQKRVGSAVSTPQLSHLAMIADYT